jgi:hypothetical protein
MALPIRGWISSAGTLRPQLMALDTSQRTSLDRAPGAFIFWRVEMTRRTSSVEK